MSLENIFGWHILLFSKLKLIKIMSSNFSNSIPHPRDWRGCQKFVDFVKSLEITSFVLILYRLIHQIKGIKIKNRGFQSLGLRNEYKYFSISSPWRCVFFLYVWIFISEMFWFHSGLNFRMFCVARTNSDYFQCSFLAVSVYYGGATLLTNFADDMFYYGGYLKWTNNNVEVDNPFG